MPNEEQRLARLLLYKDNQLLRKIAVRNDLSGAITVGRTGFGAIIDIDETYISRKHTAIFVETQQYLVVKDLDSSGGTYVNGIQITEKRLINGDTITFGGNLNTYKLVVEFVDPNQTYRTEWIQPPAETDVPEGMVVQSQTSDYTSDIAVLLAAKDEITIGRSKECDIRLPQLTITRQHAAIKKYPDGRITVRDLGSKNGTFVNGKRITEETALTNRDDISIGAFKFKLNRPAEDIRRHSAIVAEGLTREVNNGHLILRDLSFKIPAQQFVAIMGPSGCGKSTLLKAVNGDAPATSGKVFIHGLELYDNYDYLKRLMGYVPQDDIVHHELTVEQSLFYAAKLRLSGDVSQDDIREKISEVLKNLNIGDPEIRSRKVGDLSGGQRKRVSIAVELLTDPSILFLDEPTSPLDPETIEEFLMCLKNLASKGTTILMVTHKPDDLYYVDNVLFLSKGGFLTYYGAKTGYLEFFGAKNVIEVYAKNGTLALGEQWSNRWRERNPASGIVHSQNKEIEKQESEPFFKQLFWLTARYFHIKISDRTNTLILLLQAPIIAGLLGLIFDELELSVLFFMTVSAIWFGTNNAAKEIVGELAIYRRERMFNLRILPYALSKILVLSFFAFLQVVLFVGIVYFTVGNDAVWVSSYWSYVGVMFLLAFSATLMGLLVSAVVSNTEKVMTIIPIVLIPQIILSGVITKIPEKSLVEGVSYGMLSRWGTESFAYVQDSIRSYHIAIPLPAIDSSALKSASATPLPSPTAIQSKTDDAYAPSKFNKKRKIRTKPFPVDSSKLKTSTETFDPNKDKEKTSKQSKDNEDAPADSLVYETIDAIKFMDLPNSLDLPKRLSTNLYAIGIINLLCFVAMLIALKRKDSV
jgi:ABC-type multidrug transport system ATPase subunit